MKKKKLLINTNAQRIIVQKVIDELVVLSEFLDVFPKGEKINQKEWSRGCIYGMKYMIVRIAEMLDNEKLLDNYKSLIDWEGEQNRLLMR